MVYCGLGNKKVNTVYCVLGYNTLFYSVLHRITPYNTYIKMLQKEILDRKKMILPYPTAAFLWCCSPPSSL